MFKVKEFEGRYIKKFICFGLYPDNRDAESISQSLRDPGLLLLLLRHLLLSFLLLFPDRMLDKDV